MIHPVLSFFHLYWMANRDRWKTILIMYICFQISAKWVELKSLHSIASYAKSADFIYPVILGQ